MIGEAGNGAAERLEMMDCGTGGGIIRTGELSVDLVNHVAYVGGRPVNLTKKEYGVLDLLSRRKGMILTKEMLFDHLYDGAREPEVKIIDVFICRLRSKLARATGGSHYIETVWGRGYVLREPPTTPDGVSREASGI